MKVYSDVECHYKGIKKANVPFEYEGKEKNMPKYLHKFESATVEEPQTETTEKAILSEAQKERMIQETVYSFKSTDDSKWTTQGLVRLSEVQDALDFDVTRADVDQAVGAGYDRDEAANAEKKKAEAKVTVSGE